MKELDKTLLQQLSRLQAPDCPSRRTLGNFLDGKGDEEERRTLEVHLRGCPSCVNRLIDLRDLARLEQEGEEPPIALLKELKRLVPGQDLTKASAPSVLEWAAHSLSAAWSTMWRWTSPRFLGEIVVASAVAVFILLLGPRVLPQHPPDSQGGEEQINVATNLPARERSILASLSQAATGPTLFQKQLVSTLEKLPKNLLLEETRGATNVEVYKKAAPATVLVVTGEGLGSGVIISNQGEVLTNEHVIRGASRMAVVLKPQRGVEIKKELAFAATLVKVDQVADLALLKIQKPPQNMSVLSLGEITDIEVGQDVHAIGHPDGEVWTYTTGIISQIRSSYQWTGADNLLHQSKVIQTQTALNPGNSGGPLLNDRAEIIGVNSFRGEGEGLNYAVAVDVVKAFLQRAENRTTTLAPSSQASAYRMERYGANIVGVYINARIPPPDVWFVYQGAGQQLAYSAAALSPATKINTIARGADPEWQSLVYYVDVDCDGQIDLVGFDSNADGVLDRYDLPSEPLSLSSLAQELARAFQQGIIPYPQVQLCQ
ncbi:MAG: trypsin-like peptidase domain-containing protein [Candidatus Binatia bacterium]